MIWNWFVDKLIAFAKRVLSFWRNPLGRLLQRCGLSVRLHHVKSPDRDHVLYDHPEEKR